MTVTDGLDLISTDRLNTHQFTLTISNYQKNMLMMRNFEDTYVSKFEWVTGILFLQKTLKYGSKCTQTSFMLGVHKSAYSEIFTYRLINAWVCFMLTKQFLPLKSKQAAHIATNKKGLFGYWCMWSKRDICCQFLKMEMVMVICIWWGKRNTVYAFDVEFTPDQTTLHLEMRD